MSWLRDCLSQSSAASKRFQPGSEGFEAWPGIRVHGDALVATGAIEAWDEGDQLGLYLDGNSFQDSDGCGVLLHGANADLGGATWEGNAIDLVQQACGSTGTLGEDDLAEVPSSEICSGSDRLVMPIDFDLYIEEAGVEPE